MDRSLTVPLDLTAPAARARPAAPRAFLDVHHATDVARHSLWLGENRVGRANAQQEVAVPLAGGSISRVHAIIECLKDGTCFVEDQKSTNKTFFSHDPLKGPDSYSEILPGRRYQLNEDCGLRFGSVYATFHFNPDPAATQADMEVDDTPALAVQRTSTPVFTNPQPEADDAQRVVTPVLSSLSASPAGGDAAGDDGDATDIEDDGAAPAPKGAEGEDGEEEDVPVVTKRQGRLNSAASIVSTSSAADRSPLRVAPTVAADDSEGPADAPPPADASAPAAPATPAPAEEAGAEPTPAARKRSKGSSVAAEAGGDGDGDGAAGAESASSTSAPAADPATAAPEAADETAAAAAPSPPAKSPSTVSRRGSRSASLASAKSLPDADAHADAAAAPASAAADADDAAELSATPRRASAAKKAAPKRSASTVTHDDDDDEPVATPHRPATRGSHPAKKAKPAPPKEASPKKTARSAKLEALKGGAAGGDDDTPAARWYFKKDLRLKPENDNAWLAYSVGDTQELEKAYQAKKSNLRLNDKYSVSFTEMVQYRFQSRLHKPENGFLTSPPLPTRIKKWN